MELDSAAQPPNARPPAEWSKSHRMRVRVEKIRPGQHLTIFVKVCVLFLWHPALSGLTRGLCRVGYG